MKKNFSHFHQLKSSSRKPACLVAGGAGFIGSRLCEELLKQNCQVICIDNLLTGKKENLANCLENKDFTFIQHDLTKPLKMKLPKINYLFNLAGVEAYLGKKEISLDILKVNAAGTTNLLELARKNKAKFLLVSSIDVYSAALSISSLKDYYQGPKGNLFSHHEAKRFAESLVFEYFKNYHLDARIVRLGQVYGPRMNLRVGTRIVTLIKETLAGGPLRIPGNGQIPSYASFIADVIDGLLRAMFTAGTNGRIFSLVDPKETTLLSFAHELQKQSSISPPIEFVAPKEEEKLSLEKDKLLVAQRYLGWVPKTDLKEGIRQTLDYFSQGKRETSRLKYQEELIGGKAARRVPKILSRRTGIAAAVSFLILLLLLSPLLFFTFDLLWGANRLQQAKKTFTSGRFSQAASYSKSAKDSFEKAKSLTTRLDWLFKERLFDGRESSVGYYLDVSQGLAGAIYHASLAAETGSKIAAIILQNQEGEILRLTAQIKIELDSTYAQLSQVQAKLESNSQRASFSNIFGFKKQIIDLKDKLPQMRGVTLQLRKGIEVFPEMVALSGKRTYLILFQNNMELRPTGGFIGSFALATFEKGRLIDFEVHNVYSADGQLKGHVEPPAEIKKYLGEAGWYLRDSNFDPDFPTSAARAEWFLEKETGRVVDGVLAINLDFAQKILEAAGEIEIPDYQEKITAANLFERAQYHAEIGFFPGSTQKEDFLGTLARALYVRSRENSATEWFDLGHAAYQALSEKDLLVYLHEEEEMEAMADLGWDGRLRTINYQQSPASPSARRGWAPNNYFNDYLMIVEANFGVNKANFFVKRDLAHRVKINSDGTIEETLQVVYQNESPSVNLPGGRYKNYLRIYTPKDSVLKEVKIDGKALEKEKINVEQVDEKTAFGFLTEVPVKEKRKVEIAYQLAEKLKKTGQKTNYLFLVQRQSGSSKDDFNLWLNYPAEITPIKVYPQGSLGSQTIFFQPKLNQDLLFRVEF